jgi:hypothetical protein
MSQHTRARAKQTCKYTYKLAHPSKQQNVCHLNPKCCRHVTAGANYGLRLEWKAPSDPDLIIIPSTNLYQTAQLANFLPSSVLVMPSRLCTSTTYAYGSGLTLATSDVQVTRTSSYVYASELVFVDRISSTRSAGKDDQNYSENNR